MNQSRPYALLLRTLSQHTAIASLVQKLVIGTEQLAKDSLKQLMSHLTRLKSLTIAGLTMANLCDLASAFPPTLEALSWTALFASNSFNNPSLVYLLSQWNSTELRSLRLEGDMSPRTISNKTLGVLLNAVTPASDAQLRELSIHRRHWDLNAMAGDLLSMPDSLEALEIARPVHQHEDDAKTTKIVSTMISRLPNLTHLALLCEGRLMMQPDAFKYADGGKGDDVDYSDDQYMEDDHLEEVLSAAQKVKRLDLKGKRIAEAILQSIPSSVNYLTISGVRLGTGQPNEPDFLTHWRIMGLVVFWYQCESPLHKVELRPDCSFLDPLVEGIRLGADLAIYILDGSDAENEPMHVNYYKRLKSVLACWMAEDFALRTIFEYQSIQYHSSIRAEIRRYVDLVDGLSEAEVKEAASRFYEAMRASLKK